ncbi:MAG: SDR family oxidoreductase [Candidatus Margulisbacteria bacterium]|nr:SDR family oxidoreductase [Candidatus Margulisiibacteriota bacterium]MBU1021526.1 SDR family oxidoreductase [Candidatus Margulisiibacteriota bacterium]MBU1728611.1 SDR family oxidoreductase [Candidatus Margulisiibacteriota bacterium]MBU1955810.1 SDR family oxidoreductase [Candidatus Margulisiibacteriota bacterium]
MFNGNLSFEGKTALVTGGTRGIGRSIVDLLSDYGCRVIYTGTNKSRTIKNTMRDQRTYLQLDFSDDESINKFLMRLNKIPQIDILINNAGINIIESIDELNKNDWEKVLKVNLTGPMLLMKQVSKIMEKNNRGGKILNVSSIFGVISKAKRNAYSASKSGLIGLTRAAALDLAPYNILVNALCPGFTLTDLTASILTKKEIKSLSADVPLGRFAEESEIAKVALFLCSALNTYITGQTIVADGGVTIK